MFDVEKNSRVLRIQERIAHLHRVVRRRTQRASIIKKCVKIRESIDTKVIAR